METRKADESCEMTDVERDKYHHETEYIIIGEMDEAIAKSKLRKLKGKDDITPGMRKNRKKNQ